jgi:hypothetical protein
LFFDLNPPRAALERDPPLFPPREEVPRVEPPPLRPRAPDRDTNFVNRTSRVVSYAIARLFSSKTWKNSSQSIGSS